MGGVTSMRFLCSSLVETQLALLLMRLMPISVWANKDTQLGCCSVHCISGTKDLLGELVTSVIKRLRDCGISLIHEKSKNLRKLRLIDVIVLLN